MRRGGVDRRVALLEVRLEQVRPFEGVVAVDLGLDDTRRDPAEVALEDLRVPRLADRGEYRVDERDDVLATNVALAFSGIPSLDSLDAFFVGGESRAQTGYALARTAVAAIAALDRERGLSLFFQYWRQTRSMDQALRRAYGMTEAGFEAEWKARTRRRYGALALFADVSFAALLFLAVVGPLWVARRRRDRRRMPPAPAAGPTRRGNTSRRPRHPGRKTAPASAARAGTRRRRSHRTCRRGCRVPTR
jgi:hypothetical protein